jgi:hypothetical protein
MSTFLTDYVAWMLGPYRNTSTQLSMAVNTRRQGFTGLGYTNEALAAGGMQ